MACRSSEYVSHVMIARLAMQPFLTKTRNATNAASTVSQHTPYIARASCVTNGYLVQERAMSFGRCHEGVLTF